MNVITTRFSLLMTLLVVSAAAQADGLLKVEQTVFGMDCAPCAYTVQKGLSKLPGVTKVEVSLNDGKALIEFGPNSPTTLSQIREVLLHGGYTPKDAVVTVQGRIAKNGEHLELLANGTDRYDLLLGQTGGASDLKLDENVVIQGVVATPVSGMNPQLSVQNVETAGGNGK